MLERLASVTRDLDLGALGLEHARQREHVAHVVLDDEDATALEHRFAIAGVAEHALALRWKLGLHLVQEQRDLVEQALRGARSLDDDRARELLELVDLISRQ